MSQALMTQPRSDSAPADLDCRIVQAVADANGVDPLELNEQLYEVVDPDAVARLFTASTRSDKPVEGCISFTLDRCKVTVYADLTVEAYSLTDVDTD